jgi:hypothetical protein
MTRMPRLKPEFSIDHSTVRSLGAKHQRQEHFMLSESGAGANTKELCRPHGFSETTFYTSGRDPSESGSPLKSPRATSLTHRVAI